MGDVTCYIEQGGHTAHSINDAMVAGHALLVAMTMPATLAGKVS